MFAQITKSKVLTIFLSWRLLTIIYTVILFNVVNIPSSHPIPFVLWSNWDGGHYVSIGEYGYRYAYQLAFFPLYPLLIKILVFIGINSYFAALLISNIFAIGALLILYKLAKLYKLTEKQNLKSILLLITFPTAFFFIAAYTESLLLFLTVTALYFAKTKQWFLAALFAGLATFTKFTGIFVTLLLICEYFSQHKNIFKELKKTHLKKQLIVLKPLFYLLTLGLSGIVLYMCYLYYLTSNPLYFSTIQSHWGRSLSNPVTTLVEHTKKFLFIYPVTIQTFEVGTIIISLILIPFIIKKFGVALGIFTLLISTFTLFSGKTESSMRYILTAFPLFWLFAIWAEKSKLFFYTYLIIGALLQILLITLFLKHQWVG